jgi:transposase
LIGRAEDAYRCPAGEKLTYHYTNEVVEHSFGTLKMRLGATHFLMKRLPKVSTEMALHVLAYNLTRVMNIIGVQALVTAIRTCLARGSRQDPAFA